MGQCRVPLTDIIWIEGAGDYVILHTAARSHMLRTAMTALEERLAGSQLQRVHRSAIVNLNRVREVKRRARGDVALVLVDDSEAPVGPSYANEVLNALNLPPRRARRNAERGRK